MVNDNVYEVINKYQEASRRLFIKNKRIKKQMYYYLCKHHQFMQLKITLLAPKEIHTRDLKTMAVILFKMLPSYKYVFSSYLINFYLRSYITRMYQQKSIKSI